MKPVNKTVCSLAALAPLAMAQSANAGQRPNIIFFLVDDFGWTETSLPFGEETYPNNLRFHTPNMERLARTGVMMTNAYACPVSTPTRTSMMTGMNAAHMGITSYCSLYKDTCPDAIGGRPGTTNANEDDIFAHPEWNYNALCPASFRNEADSIAYGLNRTLYRHADGGDSPRRRLPHHPRRQSALGTYRHTGLEPLQHGIHGQHRRFGQRPPPELSARRTLRQPPQTRYLRLGAEHVAVLRLGNPSDRGAVARSA